MWKPIIALVAISAGIIIAAGLFIGRDAAQHCTELASVDSFDLRLTYTMHETVLGKIQTVVSIEHAGDLRRTVSRKYKDGVAAPGQLESIEDYAERKLYTRLHDEPWETIELEEDLVFPSSKDSICPDLSDATVTLIGDDTVNGRPARKYSREGRAFDWYFWIDSNGWLVQVEKTELADLGFDVVGTISGRGEPNNIAVPQVSQ